VEQRCFADYPSIGCGLRVPAGDDRELAKSTGIPTISRIKERSKLRRRYCRVLMILLKIYEYHLHSLLVSLLNSAFMNVNGNIATYPK
jgi:hypothetical protein